MTAQDLYEDDSTADLTCQIANVKRALDAGGQSRTVERILIRSVNEMQSELD